MYVSVVVTTRSWLLITPASYSILDKNPPVSVRSCINLQGKTTLPVERMVRIVPYICVQFHALPRKTGSPPCSLQPATVSALSGDVSRTSVIWNTYMH